MCDSKQQIHLWISAEDHRHLKAIADEEGQGLSTLARRVLRAYLKHRRLIRDREAAGETREAG